ncbi:MAG TPA: caspase family protein [Spirochaetales bacterium]|nr:caspase family protein [Spirochaetales bacterium]HRY56460.1 caspase family protein [Spirochaetia bacterium]HRZ65196.1 caspase family protein [Spirochaetia bacterium]
MMLRLLAAVAALATASLGSAQNLKRQAEPHRQAEPAPELRPQIPLFGVAKKASAISPDGRFMLFGMESGAIHLWDLAAGKDIRSFTGHEAPVTALDFAADGATFASGSKDMTVKLWDLATGRAIRSIELLPAERKAKGGSVLRVRRFDDRVLALSSEPEDLDQWGLKVQLRNRARVWEASSGKQLFSSDDYGHKGITDADLTKDRIVLYDTNEGGSVIAVDQKSLKPYKVTLAVSAPLGELSTARRGDLFCITNTLSKRIDVFDVHSGQRAAKYEVSIGLADAALYPDGSRLAFVGSKDMQYVAYSAAVPYDKKLTSYTPRIYAMGQVLYNPVLSQDGRFLAVAVMDSESQQVFDASSAEFVAEVNVASKLGVKAEVDFGPEGLIRRRFFQWGNLVRTSEWNIRTGEVSQRVLSRDERDRLEAPSGGGFSVLSKGGKGEEYLEVRRAGGGEATRIAAPGVVDYALTKEGRRLLVLIARESDNLQVYDPAEARLLQSLTVPGGVVQADFSYEAMGLVPSPAGGFCLVCRGTEARYIADLDAGSIRPSPSGSPFFSPDDAFLYYYSPQGVLYRQSGSGAAAQALVDFGLGGRDCVIFHDDATGVFSAISTTRDLNTGKIQCGVAVVMDYRDPKSAPIKLNFIGERCSFASASKDKRLVLLGFADGSIRLVDPRTKAVTATLRSVEDAVKRVEYDLYPAYIAAEFAHGGVQLWDRKGDRSFSWRSDALGEEWILHTEDGYWDGSKNAGACVAMVRGLDSWNIEQFAVRNNRPDIIADRMKAPPGAVAEFKYAWSKRLRRLGLSEADLGGGYAAPTVAIAQAVQDMSADKGRFVDLQVALKAAGRPLARYQVYVNDVPLFGPTGKEARGSALSISERIELTAGANKVEVSCADAAGVESLRASRSFSWSGGSTPRLYYLGFGISDYADSPAIPDLGFAAKDARDLELLFKKMAGTRFVEVRTRVLADGAATKAAVLSAKTFLADARPEDIFVLFIAGHGVQVDREGRLLGAEGAGPDFTYFYLTADTERARIRETAVEFEAIESLLQGIAPRNKLFLMDTCQSGEAEADALVAAAPGAGFRARALRPPEGRGVAVQGVSAVQAALRGRDRWIYNDLARRSGAIVISSCRAGEYSYEATDAVSWQQGAFTHEVIEAFKGKAETGYADGLITVSELRGYVQESVPRLVRELGSGIEQHPTVDRDNLSISFGFPAVRD